MTITTADIAQLDCVAKVAAWNDRHYVNLDGYDARQAGDRSLKVWIKGARLTIEHGRGYRGARISDSLAALIAAIEGLGATTKQAYRPGDSVTVYEMV